MTAPLTRPAPARTPRCIRELLLALSLFTLHIAPAQTFPPAKLAAMDAAIAEAIALQRIPGGVLWLEHQGQVHHRAYGNQALEPAVIPAQLDTIYDAASLTKVVATTTAILQLVERGRLELDAPASRYLPAFRGEGKEAITLRQLLTHTAGLRPGVDLLPAWSGPEKTMRRVYAEKLLSEPGTTFVYSDIGYLVLGELVHVASGRPLERYAAEEIFGPLKMNDTVFRPTEGKLDRVAPTERIDGRILKGEVHDPTTRMSGGIAGHAGLFTTAGDLARFCRMLVNGGELEGVRILRTETIRESTRPQTDGPARRGLGWDIDSSFSIPRGRWFPAGASFGHTGYTGTSVWVDPGSGAFVLFLANRVHPNGATDVSPLRAALGTLAAEAVGRDVGAVLNGIDVLVRDRFAPLRGLRVGLVTNASGRDRQGRATIDLLKAAPDVQLVALFSPEHGIRGNADTAVGDERDERTGLPVYSLYGASPPRRAEESAADYDLAVLRSRAPRSEQLRDLDALVFDVQDVGARFYTYSATLGALLEVAASERKKVFVLDRVNPVNGLGVEGPVMTRHPSFIGVHPLPVRHGLTLGELALLLNAEKGYNADLTVIRCENWSRSQWHDETGLPWTNPSPAMRNVTAALLYPGLCLLEGTEVSMGRGTAHPFEQIGAPFIDGTALAAELNRAGLTGVRFEAVRFTPSPALYAGPAASLKHGDTPCEGVRVMVTRRDRVQSVDIGLALALTLHRMYPGQFSPDKMGTLLGHDATLSAIKAGTPAEVIKATWTPALEAYEARRQPHLLYR